MTWFGPLLFANAALALDTAGLEEDLERSLRDSSIAGAEVGAVVHRLSNGETLFSHNADLPINPASCQKAITTLVVLDNLGPAYTLSTRIEAEGDVEEGVLDGDLYIIGRGDPEMVIERWWKLATDLKAAGIERVTGDLVLDASFFGEPGPIPGWPGGDDGYLAPSYEAPVSALSVNYNSVAVKVGPGETVGSPLRVVLEIPTEHVSLDNKAKTRGGGGQRVVVKRLDGADGPVVEVTGWMGAGAGDRTYYRNIADPLAYAGATFADFYRMWGGEIEGDVRAGEAPARARLIVSTESRPMWTLLGDMNKYSSNHIAEHLLRASAGVTLGDGSPEGGVRIAEQTLERHGVDLEGAFILNGSGLTREGRVTSDQLSGVFQALYAHPEWGDEAMTSMAVYGRDGTVRRRLRNTPAQDRVRVKTGSVAGVLTLAGVVDCDGTENDMSFALMFQGLANAWRPTRVWDQFVAGMVEACED